MRITAWSSVILLALTSPLAEASVWVVDSAGGQDFTEIADAVGAATDGDTILVRPGVYREFSIDQRALDVIADVGGAAWIRGTVRVHGLRRDQAVRLRGISTLVTSVVFPQARSEGLVLQSNRGVVYLEDCSFRGGIADNSHAAMQIDSYSGARVGDCARVIFTRCSLVGGWGPHVIYTAVDWFPGNGGHGLDATGSQVAVYDSRLIAGDGGDDDAHNYNGGAGGHGARVENGSFFMSSSGLVAGDGGYGGSKPFSCGVGGDGGSGLRLIRSATGSMLDSSATGGAGGAGGAPLAGGPRCANGADGQMVDADVGATLDRIAGLARSLEVASPIRESETSLLALSGLRGDAVMLFFSPELDFSFRIPFAGVFVPAAPYAVLPLAVPIPSSGTLEITAPTPPLPAGVDAARFTFQAVLTNSLGGAILSSPSTLTVLRVDV